MKQNKGHKNKYNNYSLFQITEKHFKKIFIMDIFFKYAFQNARLYMECLSLHIEEIQIKDHKHFINSMLP